MEEEGRPQKSKRKNADTAGLVQVHPSLFVMDENPMEFYVAKCDAQRTIQEMIKAGGGTVHQKYNPDVEEMIMLIDRNAAPATLSGNCYSIEFIIDAALDNKLPELKDYLIVIEERNVRKSATKSRPPQNKFTAEDEGRMIEFVKENSEYLPSSNYLWEKAEEIELVPGRTWKSMRAYFLRNLQPQLDTSAEPADNGEGLEEVPPPQKIRKTESAENEGTFLSNQKEAVVAAVNYLAAVTNVSRPVVIHALLVNSGVVKDALEYLKHPNEFCNSRSRTDQIWTNAEDRVLIEDDKSRIILLERERGAASVKRRKHFLQN